MSKFIRPTKKDLQEFLLMTLGITLVSVGVYFFKFPNHFSMGGVSGLAIVLAQLIPVAWLTPAVRLPHRLLLHSLFRRGPSL